MIYIKLHGGLGNQLFQYAYGRKLAIIGNIKIVFNTYYISGKKKFLNIETDTERELVLDKLILSNQAIFISRKETFFILLIKKVLMKIGLIDHDLFHGEKYFKGIEDTIRNEFALKNPLSTQSKVWEDTIKNSLIPTSLHIRRGDYVNDPKTNSYHGVCEIDYYQKAFVFLQDRLPQETLQIFVFSDDIEWAKINLSLPSPMHFVSKSSIPDYEEMYLMSICKHNIIANSSFSWWGAWLNKNHDKIVVAPKKWFSNPKSEPKDLIPQSWIRI